MTDHSSPVPSQQACAKAGGIEAKQGSAWTTSLFHLALLFSTKCSNVFTVPNEGIYTKTAMFYVGMTQHRSGDNQYVNPPPRAIAPLARDRGIWARGRPLYETEDTT